MPSNKSFPYNPNYVVEGIPRSIKAKITELINASKNHAFLGSQDPEDHEEIEEYLHVARYNLERTIKTEMSKKGL